MPWWLTALYNLTLAGFVLYYRLSSEQTKQEDFFMVKRLLLEAVMVFYQIYRLIVPASRPGRPGSHPISKFFRHTLEHKRARKAISAALTLLVMVFGQMSNLLAGETQGTAVA